MTQAPKVDVGHRRRQGLHRGRRLGLAFCRGGALSPADLGWQWA